MQKRLLAASATCNSMSLRMRHFVGPMVTTDDRMAVRRRLMLTIRSTSCSPAPVCAETSRTSWWRCYGRSTCRPALFRCTRRVCHSMDFHAVAEAFVEG